MSIDKKIRLEDREPDAFGHQSAHSEDVDYEDEDIRNGRRAEAAHRLLTDIFDNVIIATAHKEDGRPGYVGIKVNPTEKHEGGTILKALVSAVVEGAYSEKKDPHQRCYNFFAEMAGYYADNYADKVDDKYNLGSSEAFRMMKKFVDAERKKGNNLKTAVREMNDSQIESICKILGIDKENLDKNTPVPIKLDSDRLKNLSRSQRRALARLIGIDFKYLSTKEEREALGEEEDDD